MNDFQKAGPRAAARRGLVAGDRPLPLAEAAKRLGAALDDEARRAARRLPLRFPEGYVSLADPADPDDPIRRIIWPDPSENRPDPEAIDDPVGEAALAEPRFVVRKHPDRALFLLTSRCHLYCRYCFRAGHGADPTLPEIEAAIDGLAGDERLREVIFSGGDPLTLPDEFLAAALGALARLPRLATVRVHTRAPIHDPARITPDLVRALAASPRPLWIVVHAAHPRELTPRVDEALARLRGAGAALLDQTVLLRGVNADPATLAELFLGLYARQVKPYYLHHPDRVAGGARFRVTIEEGKRIAATVRESIPGPAMPSYVLDLPDGSGKTLVETMERRADGLYVARHADGRESLYKDIARNGDSDGAAARRGKRR